MLTRGSLEFWRRGRYIKDSLEKKTECQFISLYIYQPVHSAPAGYPLAEGKLEFLSCHDVVGVVYEKYVQVSTTLVIY